MKRAAESCSQAKKPRLEGEDPANHSRSAEKLALEATNPHPRDTAIRFYETLGLRSHIYLVDAPAHVGWSPGSEWPAACLSATGVKKLVVPEFDADAAIAGMRNGKRWPRKEYQHPDGTVMSDAEIKAAWDANRDEKARRGTHVHSYMEKFLNRIDEPFDPDHPWSVHIQVGQRWLEQIKERGWKPYRSEWVMWLPLADPGVHLWHLHSSGQVFRYAPILSGSVDGLFVDDKGKFHLVDFKCCKTKGLKFAFNKEKMKAPMERLEKTKFNEWRLQAAVYDHILRTKYGIKCATRRMVVLNADEGPEPQEFMMPKLDITPLLDKLSGIFGHGGPMPAWAVKEEKGED